MCHRTARAFLARCWQLPPCHLKDRWLRGGVCELGVATLASGVWEEFPCSFKSLADVGELIWLGDICLLPACTEVYFLQTCKPEAV